MTGCAGLDDLLACFCAGAALNWNGEYLAETLERHDEVNGSIDILLNFGGFMYIGMILPWDEFNQPELTGITYGRLIVLGVLILLLRRIPAMMAMFKAMPSTVKTWKEALFMGYFGPIGTSHPKECFAQFECLQRNQGIGAVFYVEHTRHLFPKVENAETEEEEHLLRAMGAVVYFLVLFSIVVHGLSIPLLEAIYRWRNVPPIVEDPVEIRPVSQRDALPNNAYIDPRRGSIVVNNRFSRANSVVTARASHGGDNSRLGVQFSFEDLERGLRSDRSPSSITKPFPRNDRPFSQSSTQTAYSLDDQKHYASAETRYDLDRERPEQRVFPQERTLTWAEPKR